MSDVVFDVIVVGSGIAGLGAARELTRLGHTVLVLEQSPDLAPAQSTRCHGWWHRSGARYAVSDPELTRGLQRAAPLVEADVSHTLAPTSVYYLAQGADTAHAYSKAWRDLGVPFQEVPSRTILSEEPHLSFDAAKFVFRLDDGIFSPHRVLRRIYRQARQTGNLTTRTETEVTRILFDQRGAAEGLVVRDRTDLRDEVIRGRWIILASGANTSRLLTASGMDVLQGGWSLWKSTLVVTPRLTSSMIVNLESPCQVVLPRWKPQVSVIDAASDHPTNDANGLAPEPLVVGRILGAVKQLLPGTSFPWHKGYCCVKPSYSSAGPSKSCGSFVTQVVPGLIAMLPGKFSLYPLAVKECVNHVLQGCPC